MDSCAKRAVSTISVRFPRKSKDLLDNYANFKRSGLPERVMWFEGGRWVDLEGEALEGVRVGFREGRAVVEGVVGGERCLFDFVRMEVVEFGSGRRRPVAWIDVGGSCFFPKSFIFDGVDEGQFRHFEDVKIGIDVRFAAAEDEFKLEKRKKEFESGNDVVSRLEDIKLGTEVRSVAAAAAELKLDKRRELESENDAVSRLEDVKLGIEVRSRDAAATAAEFKLGKRKRELESGNVAVSRLEDVKIGIQASSGAAAADELKLGKRKREFESGNGAVSSCWVAPESDHGEAGECSDGSQSSSNRGGGGRHLLVKRALTAADDSPRHWPSCRLMKDGDISRCRALKGALEAARWPNCRPIKPGHRGFETVKRLFLARLRPVDPRAEVTSVCHFVRTGGLARARFLTFKRCVELTAAARGKPNVVFGWYRTTAEGVARITGYGFTAPDDVNESSGVGVHLCPVSLPDLSAVDPEPDENGEKHIILCRVLMGNVEKVEAGSKQCCATSSNFDNGVDDLKNPKRCIVWCANMNTHILPECVLSFRSSVQV